MAGVVVPTFEKLEALDLLGTATTGRWDAFAVRLFQNDFTPVAGTAVGDFTEADFSGYAAVTGLTWNPAYLDYQAGASLVSELVAQFLSTVGSPFVGNTIYGWYATKSFGSTSRFLFGERFLLPITVDIPDRIISILPAVPWSSLLES